MHNFEFAKPSTIADAARMLAADGAQALSGGQTLIPTMKQRLAAPGVLVSLTGIAEMRGVCTGDGGLHIGAATPHAVVAKEAARHYPALAALAGGIGDPSVRSRGTIGGSIANNDPAADFPALHDSTLQQTTARARRPLAIHPALLDAAPIFR